MQGIRRFALFYMCGHHILVHGSEAGGVRVYARGGGVMAVRSVTGLRHGYWLP